jgi:hypothetical protein
VFKNLKKLGLGPDYQRDKTTRKICRQIMSLNLLPADKIEKRFSRFSLSFSRLALALASQRHPGQGLNVAGLNVAGLNVHDPKREES